jgi:dTDP-4-dehydrorhamnose reductase
LKIALTGSGGMLGHDIKRVFSDVDLIALTRHDVDITDLNKTLRVIQEIKPDYVIHAAAYTDVDGSEHDPDRACRVNGIGTRNITMASEAVHCPVMYISSDYVFDGAKKTPYNEWDIPGPINQYGISKLLGEKFVSSLTNKFYIVRTSWLYGEKGKNFVDTIGRLLTEREELEVVDDQTGSPTYTYDLAVRLKEIIGRGYGIYHVTNSSQCSWYEFATEIARIKSSKTRIKPTTSAQFKLPAERPVFSVLNNAISRLEGLSELRHWNEALRAYLGR